MTGIAIEKVKFDPEYQEKRGILQGVADNIPPELQNRIEKLVRRICRNLDLDGYARIDFRLTADGVPYFLEANPNLEMTRQEVFAEAARYAGARLFGDDQPHPRPRHRPGEGDGGGLNDGTAEPLRRMFTVASSRQQRTLQTGRMGRKRRN